MLMILRYTIPLWSSKNRALSRPSFVKEKDTHRKEFLDRRVGTAIRE